MTKFYEQPCTFTNVADTFNLQKESLIRFAAALGYEVVEDQNEKLINFHQPKFACTGEATVSVNRMILLHNNLAGYLFEEIQISGYEYIETTRGHAFPFDSFINRKGGVDAITALFAGTCKIVKKVKLTHSKRNGLTLQSNKIQFNTKLDRAHYGHLVS